MTTDVELADETKAMNYEKFMNEADASNSHPNGHTNTNSISIGTTELSDCQITIQRDPDVVAAEEGQEAAEYISDPGGDRYNPQTQTEAVQLKIKNIVEHVGFRALTILLILLDFILVIVDLAINACSELNAIEVISHIIITYFVLEILARIFYKGRDFFRDIWDVIDMIIVFLSFIVDMVFAGIESSQNCKHGSYAKLVVIGRVFRAIRIVRTVYIIYTQKRQVAIASRQLVSQNKRRYQKDGFDLDLCYITERIIAMSFPSRGLMSMYRNPIDEVVRFFETKHKDHYKLYNLCSERDYDETKFQNRVERVYIDDHNCPKLKDMIAFADNVREWMEADAENVIAVHCKGGKGRTGTMICTWLVESGLFDEAQDSLEYFGDRRTDLSVGSKYQGVETPSQSRYVGYFEYCKKVLNGVCPKSKQLRVTSIKIEGITDIGPGDGSDLSMEIRCDGLKRFECHLGKRTNCEVMQYLDAGSIVISLTNSPVLTDDVKISFMSSANIPKGYENSPYFFWFHCSFIENNKLHLPRDELDNPHKKKTWNVYKDNFALEVLFETIKDPF